MLFYQLPIWRGSLFFIVLIAVVCTFFLFQKGSNHKDRHLFMMHEPSFVALDQEIFENKKLFERATMLTAQTFKYASIMRHFSGPLTSMAIEPLGKGPQRIYTTQGYNLVQTSLDSGADQVFSLKNFLQSPIMAMTHDPRSTDHLFAISKNHEVLSMDLRFKRPRVESLGWSPAIPAGMKIEEMWTNPFNKTILVSATKDGHSIILTINPKNWKISESQILLQNQHITGGLSISKNIELISDKKYHLFVIDTEKRIVIGSYEPNPNFRHLDLKKSTLIALGSFNKKIFFADSQNNIVRLTWSPNENTLIMNKNVKIQKNKIIINWKFPKKNKKRIFIAEIQKGKPLNPTTRTTMELPISRREDQQVDVKMLAIHSGNGKIISPAINFFIDTSREIIWKP